MSAIQGSGLEGFAIQGSGLEGSTVQQTFLQVPKCPWWLGSTEY